MKINKLAHQLFKEGYLISPLEKGLTYHQKRKYLLSSIALGILSIGTAHLVAWGLSHQEIDKRRKIEKFNKNNADIDAIRKRRLNKNIEPQNKISEIDLTFRKKINLGGTQIKEPEKKILINRSKLLVNVSSQALKACLKSLEQEFPAEQPLINQILDDPSRLIILKEHPNVLTRLTTKMHVQGFELPMYYTSKQFANEELDHIREQERLKFKTWKKFNLAGKSDLDYKNPKVDLKGLKLSPSNRKLLNTACLKDFRKAQQHLDWSVADACMEYFNKKDNKFLNLINQFSLRYLDLLRAMAAINPPTVQAGVDPFHAYLQNIFANTETFSGSIGNSPQKIINLIEGKYDSTEKPYPLLRTKLFFLYRLAMQANEVMKSPILCKEIDRWLKANGKDWQLEAKLIGRMKKKAPFFMSDFPLYVRGVQALQNEYFFLRTQRSPKSQDKQMKLDPNPTFHQAHQASVMKSYQNKRFRTEFTRQELVNYTGEIDGDQEKAHREQLKDKAILEKKIRNIYDLESIRPKFSKHSSRLDYLDLASPVKPDTSYTESLQEYKKKTTRIPWVPGKHAFRLHPNIPIIRYNKIVKKLGLPTKAGISGTLDQTLVMAGMVGMHSQKEQMDLRFIYLAWMLSSEDHSFHEIMQSSKTFGLPYTAAADSYKQVYPDDPTFVKKIAKHQKKRGFELPDYYLSNEFAKIKAKKLFADSV